MENEYIIPDKKESRSRKFCIKQKSGSIEGASPTSAGPNLIAALSGNNDIASVGTWKLIKGKVSQTIEDIKSSKTSNQNLPTKALTGEQQQQSHNEPDSDVENATAHSSISEDLPLDLERKSSTIQRGGSDSSLDSELLLEGDTGERSRLRRGLANLKSKVKSKASNANSHPQRHHHHHLHQHSHHTHQSTGLATAALSSATISTAFGTAAIKSTNATATAPPTTVAMKKEVAHQQTTKHGFIRRRRRSPAYTDDTCSVQSPMMSSEDVSLVNVRKKKRGIVSGKKEVEIESGVEMMEDTIPESAGPENDQAGDNTPGTSNQNPENPSCNVGKQKTDCDIQTFQVTVENESQGQTLQTPRPVLREDWQSHPERRFYFNSLVRRLPLVRIAGFLMVLLMPVNSFIRGVFACLMSIAIVDSLVETFVINVPTEKSKFKVPDYSKMPICEIPAVEEYTTVKAYSGWMNEIFSYDPNDFHVSMTHSVYVKLDGTVLRVSSTAAHIPKRAMWNEAPIDIKTLPFQEHRTYDLYNCRIEMLPLGLARKRYFNRKYPIQLIMQRAKSCVLSQVPSLCPSAESLHADPQTNEPGDDNTKNTETVENRSERSVDIENEIDFGATILNADLSKLQVPTSEDSESSLPNGDEIRLLLFARTDREKEDWYRRFVAASNGDIQDQMLHLPNLKLVEDAELQRAVNKTAHLPTEQLNKEPNATATDVPPIVIMQAQDKQPSAKQTSDKQHADKQPADKQPVDKHTADRQQADKHHVDKHAVDKQFTEIFKDAVDDVNMGEKAAFQGLLMSSCAARNPLDYIRFMATYQKACNVDQIPVMHKPTVALHGEIKDRRQRRARRNEEELWKGIDQSLFLGPSGSVVWANVLIGRFLFSCLHDNKVRTKIQELLQKKLSSIRLPSFMEDVIITNINLGDTPPLIHRVSQPFLDERGTWMDADITYEGLLQLTVTTKLNLMRVKNQKRVAPMEPPTTSANVPQPSSSASSLSSINVLPVNSQEEVVPGSISSLHSDIGVQRDQPDNVIFNSDAESLGATSSEEESPTHTGVPTVPPTADHATPTTEHTFIQSTPGNARRIFKIVDRIATSNFFQYATDLPYVQRAMENLSSVITLRIDVKGLVGRGTLNIPPPPSDRLWLSFRGPPRLWLSAKPAFGDKSVDYSIVTNIIESKLCEELNKILVYPNMVDVTIPFLGQPTYEYNKSDDQENK